MLSWIFRFSCLQFGSSQSTTQSIGANQCPLAPPSPAKAPEPGYQYFMYYSSLNGAIVKVETRPSCQVARLSGSGPKADSQIAAMNVTSNAALQTLMPNGYLNAYYVNLHTGQLTVKPGVTFNDPYHALFNGQSITNGTQIPTPSQ